MVILGYAAIKTPSAQQLIMANNHGRICDFIANTSGAMDIIDTEMSCKQNPICTTTCHGEYS